MRDGTVSLLFYIYEICLVSGPFSVASVFSFRFRGDGKGEKTNNGSNVRFREM